MIEVSQQLEETNGTSSDATIEFGLGLLTALPSENFDFGLGANIFFELLPPGPITARASFAYYSTDSNSDYLSKSNSSNYTVDITALLKILIDIQEHLKTRMKFLLN